MTSKERELVRTTLNNVNAAVRLALARLRAANRQCSLALVDMPAIKEKLGEAITFLGTVDGKKLELEKLLKKQEGKKNASHA